jgi:hypothetical protein
MTSWDISSAERALASGDIAGLCDDIAARFPDSPELSSVEALVRRALGDTSRVADTPESKIFFDSIDTTRRLLDSGQSDTTMVRRIEIGKDLDFIANLQGIAGWSIPQFLNFLMIRRITPTGRAAVVGTMRDDGIYVLEWISYYRALGFEHIFIYTNDNADGSEELLRKLADHGVITLIESETNRRVAPEVKASEHSLQLLHDLRRFEWVLYVDSDEFFVPAPRFDNSVSNVITGLHTQFPDRLPSAVCYSWRWYVSGMAFARTGAFLIERFQHARPHPMSKALVRLPDVMSMRFEHYPEVVAGGLLVDSRFDMVPNVEQMWSEWRPQYDGGWINHYWPKSFEEFAIKKARGQTLRLEVNSYDRPFAFFFQWNGYETPDNHLPVDPVVRNRVVTHVAELRSLEGVAEVADRIDRQFHNLVAHYYGDRDRLRSLYEEHMTGPTDL